MKTKALFTMMAVAFVISVFGFSSALEAARTKQTARKSTGGKAPRKATTAAEQQQQAQPEQATTNTQ